MKQQLRTTRLHFVFAFLLIAALLQLYSGLATVIGSDADGQQFSRNSERYDVQVGSRQLLALQQRTPLGNRFSNGLIMLNVGSEALESSDGVGWKPATPGYTGGAWQLTADVQNGRMVAYSYLPLTWNAARGAYESSVTLYRSPTGSAITSRPVRFYGIPVPPGGSTVGLYPGMVVNHNGRMYMTLWHYYVAAEPWRGATVNNARLIASYLVRAVSQDSFVEFEYVSRIASRESVPPISTGALPLYYAAEPSVMSLDDTRMLAVMRTSADDDDGARKLDPAVIFSGSTNTFSDRAYDFWGADAVASVWSPTLDVDQYYQGEQPQPPILLARSDDSGVTWNLSYLPFGGISPVLSYDSSSDIVAMAVGATHYPRRGHAISYSLDRGDSWSQPVWLPDSADGRTTGSTVLLNLGPGSFVLAYDILPAYIQASGGEDFSTYRGYSRVITIAP